MRTGLETREELFAVMEQIAEEREIARPIVRELAARGKSIDDIEIPEGWRTAGMVLELCDSAYSQMDSQPTNSVSLGWLALTIATTSGTEGYPPPVPAYLEGRSWKEIGYGYRYINAYDPAVTSQKIAECILSREGSLIHEQAATQFARSGTLFKEEKYREARQLNERTAELFRVIDDSNGEFKAAVLDASIDLGDGAIDAARQKFERILKKSWATDDLHTLGVVYHNLAHCYRYLNRLSDAVTTFEKAKEIFSELDLPAEVNRADWGLAAILVEKEPDKALPIFRRLRDDYLARNMPGCAGEIGLIIVDALIATNQLGAARRLIKTVLKEFLAAKLDAYAISASAYLRDLDKMKGTPPQAETRPSALERTHAQELTAANENGSERRQTRTEGADRENELISDLLSMSRENRAALVNANWRNPAVVRTLITLIDRENFSQPKHAADLAALAVEIAQSIEPARFPTDGVPKLRVDAWRELGYALYYIGSFRESLTALSAADDELKSCEDTEFDSARIALNRASVYGEIERPDEALVLADFVADVANRLGNDTLLHKAFAIKALILTVAHKYAEALLILTDLSRDARDQYVHASALQNAGICCRELLQLDQAKTLLVKAAEEFESLGLSTPLAKTRWSLGSVLLREQRYHEALDLFRQAREEFEEHGMAQDVALTSIDTSEVLLMLNRPAEVVKLCQSAMRYFADADLAYTESAMTALAYLKEAAASRTLRQAQLKRVRDFLEVLPKQPKLLFATAPEPN